MFKIGFEFWRPTFFSFVYPTFVFLKIKVSEWIGLSPIGLLLGRILSQTMLNLVKFNPLVRILRPGPVFCGQRSRTAFMHYLFWRLQYLQKRIPWRQFLQKTTETNAVLRISWTSVQFKYLSNMIIDDA